MADTEKDAVKAAKEAEKAAKKAKQERVKGKPKKDPSTKGTNKIKKYWKDFVGTVKKIVWPGRAQVLKSSAVVLVSIIVVGLVIFGFDRGLSALFNLGTSAAEKAAQQMTTEAVVQEEDSLPAVTDPANPNT